MQKSSTELACQIKQCIAGVIYHDEGGFTHAMGGWFNTWKPITVIHHINKMKDKNHIIISLYVRKAFDDI